MLIYRKFKKIDLVYLFIKTKNYKDERENSQNERALF